jgi:hypothetical protein
MALRAGKTIIEHGYLLILQFSIRDCPGSRIAIWIASRLGNITVNMD